MTARPEPTDTKTELMLAAERLFATQGIAATTIRQINAAAGQKNQSAIHYHFGSRDAVLDAIVAMRVEPLNIERARLIEARRAARRGGPWSAAEIAEVLIEPNIGRLMNSQEPQFAARLMLQLRVDHDVWRRYERIHLAWTLHEIYGEMRRARPFMPPEVVRSRYRLAQNLSMTSLAEIEQAMDRLGARFSREDALFRLEELRVMLVQIIDAPVSPGGVSALGALRESRGRPGGLGDVSPTD